jgi:hypothetical protein
MQDLSYLLPHAVTDRQREIINAVIKHGGYRPASKIVGTDNSCIRRMVERLKAKAGAEGSVPELGIDKPFPNTGNIAKGYSRYFKADDGGFWIKTDVPMSERVAIAQAAIAALCEELKPLKPIKLDAKWSQPSELLNLYVLSDIHFGALSWAKETGADWNLDIAEQVVIDAFVFQVENSPPAEHAIFCNLGDALHYDSMRAETPTHHHHVDADSRPQKMVETAIRVFRRAVDMLARKHKRVTLIHASGNHDPYGSIHLQEWSKVIYEANPRIEVIRNPSPYYALTHGRTFLGFHHGHKAKMARLVEVFGARQYWDMKARCRMAYIHSGHEHHHERKEFNGGICEMHPTLCARSSYESHSGYSADRSMACITYHTKGREHSRITYYPEEVA